MATKGNKILWIVKTRWISTLNPIEKVMPKYKIVKVALDGEMQLEEVGLDLPQHEPFFHNFFFL